MKSWREVAVIAVALWGSLVCLPASAGYWIVTGSGSPDQSGAAATGSKYCAEVYPDWGVPGFSPTPITVIMSGAHGSASAAVGYTEASGAVLWNATTTWTWSGPGDPAPYAFHPTIRGDMSITVDMKVPPTSVGTNTAAVSGYMLADLWWKFPAGGLPIMYYGRGTSCLEALSYTAGSGYSTGTPPTFTDENNAVYTTVVNAPLTAQECPCGGSESITVTTGVETTTYRHIWGGITFNMSCSGPIYSDTTCASRAYKRHLEAISSGSADRTDGTVSYSTFSTVRIQ